MAVGHRSYAATCCVCLLLTLFVPIWSQAIKYRIVDFSSPEMLSTVLAGGIALSLYYLFGLLLTALLRLDLTIRSTIDALTYALTPLNLALWLVYAFNYAHSGRLTVVTYVLTGAGNIHDVFFGQLSIVAIIVCIWVLFVAYQCVQSGTDELGTAPFAYVLLLAPSTALSVALGTLVGDIIRPGFLRVILQLLRLSVSS